MADRMKGDSGRVPITGAEEVRHLAGNVSDHTVIEILKAQPTIEDLVAAAMYARGETSDVVAEEHGLSGTCAVIYDALMQDEIYRPDET